MYLEKLGDDHLEEALREMDSALQRMPRCGFRGLVHVGFVTPRQTFCEGNLSLTKGARGSASLRQGNPFALYALRSIDAMNTFKDHLRICLRAPISESL